MDLLLAAHRLGGEIEGEVYEPATARALDGGGCHVDQGGRAVAVGGGSSQLAQSSGSSQARDLFEEEQVRERVLRAAEARARQANSRPSAPH
jgi:hypothetical protein